MTASLPLTARQAAAELGWGDSRAAGRKLARLICTKEGRIRRSIFSAGGGAKGSTRLVTMAALRRWMPELFDRREEVAEIVQHSLEEINGRIDVLQLLLKVQGAKVRGLARAIAERRAERKNRP